MNIVILKYNAGNIRSVEYALNRLGYTARISNLSEDIMKADRLIIPGVGSSGLAMKYLKDRKLDGIIRGLKIPVLGICLGMQILYEYLEESNTPGMGIISGKVKKFIHSPKIPHIGWNSVISSDKHLFRGIKKSNYFYFVHSYYAENTKDSIAFTRYGKNFTVAVRHKNFFGVQFHPEKSGSEGENLIKNFLSKDIGGGI